MKSLKNAFLFFFALSVVSLAQQKEDYSKYPGYFSYKDFGQLKNAESTTEIYLEEPLLKMVAGLAGDKKDELVNVIRGLKLVSVSEYKIPIKELADMASTIESMGKDLQSKKWNSIARFSMKGKTANIYIKNGSDGEIVGLTILSLDKVFDKGDPYDAGKVTFVNIVGKIDLSTIGKLSEQFNIPGLGNVKKEK